VELRVLEGDLPNATDITFAYGANFFLFATLENARTMATGRVNPSPSSVPVLTGTPVAGMAYLDRPHQAGYFIFPDLSVRHEGKYRLGFALYEETKEDKDRDPEDPPRMDGAEGSMGTHFSHRLEVKSAPFTVFSAKKFPGLTESTQLSRMVAEQGCRVRIRRDVRMRRRDNKHGKEWENYEEEESYERARRTATPDAYGQAMPTPQPMMDGGDRPRSVSNASNASFQMGRRPSMEMPQGYAQGYQNHMPAPQPAQPGYPSMAYNHQQPQQYQGQFSQPQQPMMQPPHAQYQPPQTPYQAPNGYQAPPMQAPQSYGYSQSYQQPGYEQPHHVKHESMEYQSSPPDYRRPGPPPAQPQPQPQYQPQPPVSSYSADPYSRPGQPAHTLPPHQASLPQQHAPPTPTSHSMTGHALAPLKTLQPPTDKLEPVSPSYNIPPVNTDPAPFPKYSTPPATAGTKRSYGQTFNTAAMDQPLRQGARPPPVEDYGANDFDDEDILDKSKMTYRRADGTQRNRRIPLQ
jgi:hypothetical protein